MNESAKKDQIYSELHEDIMHARIKIKKILGDDKAWDEVDNVLSDLNMSAPQKAIQFSLTDAQRDEELLEFIDQYVEGICVDGYDSYEWRGSKWVNTKTGEKKTDSEILKLYRENQEEMKKVGN